jgi:hypothetical protein
MMAFKDPRNLWFYDIFTLEIILGSTETTRKLEKHLVRQLPGKHFSVNYCGKQEEEGWTRPVSKCVVSTLFLYGELFASRC